jgi:anaerobic selenocysteine-containing dehydrogenase
MFNFVRLSDGGTANVSGGMRAESAVICDLAMKVLGREPVDWSRLRSHKEIRKLISEVIPGWKEIGTMDETKKEFTISGRIYHEPHFNTESGRALMHQTPLPDGPADGFRLVTLRSEGQFNTVVYEEPDIYRGMPHRNCILISSQDAGTLKLNDGQRVTVRGEAGSLENIEVVFGNIKSGVVAMFFPESNVLIKGKVDPSSKTPAFKSSPVWIDARRG